MMLVRRTSVTPFPQSVFFNAMRVYMRICECARGLESDVVAAKIGTIARAENVEQHFVPRFYLAGFSDPDTRGRGATLWHYDLKKRSWSREKAKDIGKTAEYYTSTDQSGARNLDLERAFQWVENRTAVVAGSVLVGMNFVPALLEKEWILCASRETEYFIVSDSPVFQAPIDDGSAEGQIEVTFPLSRNLCVLIRSGDNRVIRGELVRQGVSEVNRRTAFGANVFLAAPVPEFPGSDVLGL
jgi:Protein of unknown function (DUF4238)